MCNGSRVCGFTEFVSEMEDKDGKSRCKKKVFGKIQSGVYVDMKIKE